MAIRSMMLGLVLTLGMAAGAVGQPAGPVVGPGRATLVVTPPQGEAGDTFAVTLQGFPNANAKGDALVVVPVGTREFDPRQVNIPSPPGIKLLYKHWIYRNEDRVKADGSDITVGPYAPGSYEVRHMTLNYNNDGRYETSARTVFTVK